VGPWAEVAEVAAVVVVDGSGIAVDIAVECRVEWMEVVRADGDRTRRLAGEGVEECMVTADCSNCLVHGHCHLVAAVDLALGLCTKVDLVRDDEQVVKPDVSSNSRMTLADRSSHLSALKACLGSLQAQGRKNASDCWVSGVDQATTLERARYGRCVGVAALYCIYHQILVGEAELVVGRGIAGFVM